MDKAQEKIRNIYTGFQCGVRVSPDCAIGCPCGYFTESDVSPYGECMAANEIADLIIQAFEELGYRKPLDRPEWREKIYDILKKPVTAGRLNYDSYHSGYYIKRENIDKIIDLILALGLPKDKPPLLNKIAIDERTKNCVGANWASVKENIEWVAQTQRDICIQWNEGINED